MLAYAFNAFFNLNKLIKKHQISHCIAYFSIPFGPLAWYMKLRWGIPYINSLRGGDVPGLVSDLNTIHKLITPLRRKVLASAITSIANAEGLANLSRKADPQIIEVIPNGVDTDFYQPLEKPTKSETFNFVFVGRFHEQKNIYYLLEQFSKVLKENTTCHLHLIGDGGLNEAVRNHAQKLGINNHLSWHGWLNKDELKNVYQMSDCMINPSHYEGLPNTVLEGMACALPVIVSDIPGNNDLIIDNQNGYLFKLDDPEGLFQCMLKILKHNNVSELGKNGRSRVMQHYTWAMVAEMYEKCLKR